MSAILWSAALFVAFLGFYALGVAYGRREAERVTAARGLTYICLAPGCSFTVTSPNVPFIKRTSEAHAAMHRVGDRA